MFCASCLLTACPEDDAKKVDAGPREGGFDPNAYMGGSGGNGGNGGNGGAAVNDSAGGTGGSRSCQPSSESVAVGSVDQVDLLLVVDNSSTMAAEQRSLKAALPSFIKILSTGYRTSDDAHPFPPIKDLHVGVVSTDMGVPGVEIPPECHADGGDDGKLQNMPHGDNCDASYPHWLNFVGDPKIAPVTDPAKFANDVGCIASLGTSGCSFEQQLEAPFKALMPRLLTDASGNVITNPYRFIATVESNTWGRGDTPAAQGGNQGFLRNTLGDPSLIAIVLVTDEEDCSVKTTDHLKPSNQLPVDSPYRMEDMNLRCHNHPENYYDVELRYFQGFRGLRPGREHLVVFTAIAGVPTDLVDREALSTVDFDDVGQRDRFYSGILKDSRMEETVDPSTMPGSGKGNLVPSCVRTVAGEDMPAKAYPPRRIVQLARLFGANGLVQSICQDDFSPALGLFANVIAKRLGEQCLPKTLYRHSDGLVDCEIIWELPRLAVPGAPTPVRCDQLAFLGPVDDGRPPTNASGGANCKVNQLAVTNTGSKAAPAGDGWFYDDYTDERARSCAAEQPQRIAFSSNAKPPTGVTVKLECPRECGN